MANKPISRCTWCGTTELYQHYHDTEWGVPEKNEQALFEMLNLEGAQAGLNWYTILQKREHYRKVYDGFNAEKMARYGDKKNAALLNDKGIVRNRLKVAAFVTNAQAYLNFKAHHGCFSEYLWRYVDGQPIQNDLTGNDDTIITTKASDQMSKDLKKLGFKFVGSTICYAFMQAAGMVNDHSVSCFRHKEVQALSP